MSEFKINFDDCEDEKHGKPPKPHPPAHTHVHEILGSVMLAENGEDRHNHRFATVSSAEIPLPHGQHRHAFLVNTDSFDHFHEVGGESGPAVDVGNGKHVHFASGVTSVEDRHSHKFQVASLIQSPLLFR